MVDIWPGAAYPLGATFDGSGTNFALFSEVAERIELCLFDEEGTETRVEVTEVDAYVWHCYVPSVQPGLGPPLSRSVVFERAEINDAHGWSASTVAPTKDREAETRASYFEALSTALNRGWAPLTGVLECPPLRPAGSVLAASVANV